MFTHKRLWLLAVAVLGLGALGVPKAQADFESDFNTAGTLNFAVLYEGNGNNTLNINSAVGPGSPPSFFTVTGNIGIGDPSGATTASLAINNPGGVNGNVLFAGAKNVSMNNGTNSAGMTITGNNASVTNALTAINNESASLGTEMGTPLTVNLNNNQTQTITATNGKLDANGNYVFTLSALTFNNGATLTIDGTGLTANQDVVINVTANGPQFGGTIVLANGITSDQVLFNFPGGTGGTTLSGGPSLQISTNGATLQGIFLDPNGPMSIQHSVLDGRFFGGDSSNMQIVSGGYINAPSAPMTPVPEPSTLCLLGLGGLCLVGYGWRRKLAAA